MAYNSYYSSNSSLSTYSESSGVSEGNHLRNAEEDRILANQVDNLTRSSTDILPSERNGGMQLAVGPTSFSGLNVLASVFIPSVQKSPVTEPTPNPIEPQPAVETEYLPHNCVPALRPSSIPLNCAPALRPSSIPLNCGYIAPIHRSVPSPSMSPLNPYATEFHSPPKSNFLQNTMEPQQQPTSTFGMNTSSNWSLPPPRDEYNRYPQTVGYLCPQQQRMLNPSNVANAQAIDDQFQRHIYLNQTLLHRQRDMLAAQPERSNRNDDNAYFYIGSPTETNGNDYGSENGGLMYHQNPNFDTRRGRPDEHQFLQQQIHPHPNMMLIGNQGMAPSTSSRQHQEVDNAAMFHDNAAHQYNQNGYDVQPVHVGPNINSPQYHLFKSSMGYRFP